MTISARYRVDANNVAWRVADGEAVLLHADSSAYFGLNQTGTLLWIELAGSPMTPEQLATWAKDSFADYPSDAAEAIATFVEALLALHLVEIDEGHDALAPVAPSKNAGSDVVAWEPPSVERFGELEKLILSGE